MTYDNHALIREIRDREDLTKSEKLIALLLVTYRNAATGKCFPGQQTLALKSGLSRGCVNRCIGRLKKLDILRLDGGNKKGRNYVFLSSSDPQKKSKTRSYADYLLTEHWANIRSKALRFSGNKCQLCNSPKNLHVHHRSYDCLNKETMSDVITLCKECHEKFHNVSG